MANVAHYNHYSGQSECSPTDDEVVMVEDVMTEDVVMKDVVMMKAVDVTAEEVMMEDGSCSVLSVVDKGLGV